MQYNHEPCLKRPRRLRVNPAIRSIIRESRVNLSGLIQPYFVHEKSENEPNPNLPGLSLWSVEGLLEELERTKHLGIRGIMIFPKIELKTDDAAEALNDGGLVPKTIQRIKQEFPNLLVCSDVALDPYTLSGHDGIADGNGYISEDRTVEVLVKQALTHAKAGVDIICPSDMMDGRVRAIRKMLDRTPGCQHIAIMSYTAKYASNLYTPFRDALASHGDNSSDGKNNPKSSEKECSKKGDSGTTTTTTTVSKIIEPCCGFKSTYQMDFSNGREAMREAELDEKEGADIMIVKPGLFYLDIVAKMRMQTNLPIAVYHVSGEYSMIKSAAASGYLSEKVVAIEALKCLKRAGADVIITYYATEVAKWLKDGEVVGDLSF